MIGEIIRKNIIAVACFFVSALVTILFSLVGEAQAEKMIEKMIAAERLDAKYYSDGWVFNYTTIHMFIAATAIFCLAYYLILAIMLRKENKYSPKTKRLPAMAIAIVLYAVVVVFIIALFWQLALLILPAALSIVVIASLNLFLMNRRRQKNDGRKNGTGENLKGDLKMDLKSGALAN